MRSLEQIVYGRDSATYITKAETDACTREINAQEKLDFRGRRVSSDQRERMIKRAGGDPMKIAEAYATVMKQDASFASTWADVSTNTSNAPVSSAAGPSDDWITLTEATVFPDTANFRAARAAGSSGTAADTLVRLAPVDDADAPASARGGQIVVSSPTAGEEFVVNVAEAARSIAATGFSSNPPSAAVLAKALVASAEAHRGTDPLEVLGGALIRTAKLLGIPYGTMKSAIAGATTTRRKKGR